MKYILIFSKFTFWLFFFWSKRYRTMHQPWVSSPRDYFKYKYDHLGMHVYVFQILLVNYFHWWLEPLWTLIYLRLLFKKTMQPLATIRNRPLQHPETYFLMMFLSNYHSSLLLQRCRRYWLLKPWISFACFKTLYKWNQTLLFCFIF